MTTEELKGLTVAKSIDSRGTACPGPLLAAKKAIGEIASGDIMEILSADEGTKKDIPKWAKKKGHDYLGTVEESGYFIIYMKNMETTKSPKILVFSTEKISDPALDLAGLLKLHYSPTVYTVNVPCSSSIKTRWIMRAFDKGFDGVFIAADGTDCPYGEQCGEMTGKVVARTHELMKSKEMNPARLKMAALCSVCAEAFVKHVDSFSKVLLKMD